jgi:hypothetical protein
VKRSRKAALPVLALLVSMVAGCAIPLKSPPAISYDDDAQPAVQLADPPKPVEIVEVQNCCRFPDSSSHCMKPSRRWNPVIHANAWRRPTLPPACSRPAMATSMPFRSIRLRQGRSIRSTPRRGR